MRNKRQKTMTAKEFQQHLDHLASQVQRIRLSFTFKGTKRQQSKTVRQLESLDEETQLYVMGCALANHDYFGRIAGVFILREEALERAATVKGDL